MILIHQGVSGCVVGLLLPTYGVQWNDLLGYTVDSDQDEAATEEHTRKLCGTLQKIYSTSKINSVQEGNYRGHKFLSGQ